MTTPTIYIVKSGDTLSRIAQQQLGAIDQWRTVAALNKLTAPYTIYPGQRLQLPSGAPRGQSIETRDFVFPADQVPDRNNRAQQVATAPDYARYLPWIVGGAVLVWFIMGGES